MALGRPHTRARLEDLMVAEIPEDLICSYRAKVIPP